MTRIAGLAIALACPGATGCQTVYEGAAAQVGQAVVFDRTGARAGTARLYALGDEVTFNVAFERLPPGAHAMRLSARGTCSTAGLSSTEGASLGYLPDVRVAADGVGTMSSILQGTRAGVLASVFDEDGSSIVVEQRAAPTASDAATASAEQIACGVVAPA